MSDEASGLIRVGGRRLVDLSAIVEVHWDGEKLFVYLAGGRFFQLVGEEARALWDVVDSGAKDLRRGEAQEM